MSLGEKINQSVAETVLATLQMHQKQQAQPQAHHQPSTTPEQTSVPQAVTTKIQNQTHNKTPTSHYQHSAVTDEVNNTSSVKQLQTILEKFENTHSVSKPLFSTYNSKTDVFMWKSTCLLALAVHRSKRYNSV